MTDSPAVGRLQDRGMIFPFKPLCLTFDKIRYSVDMPKVIMIYRLKSLYYPLKEIYLSEILKKYYFFTI